MGKFKPWMVKENGLQLCSLKSLYVLKQFR